MTNKYSGEVKSSPCMENVMPVKESIYGKGTNTFYVDARGAILRAAKEIEMVKRGVGQEFNPESDNPLTNPLARAILLKCLHEEFSKQMDVSFDIQTRQ